MSVLTISAKNLNPEVNYHSFGKFEFNKSQQPFTQQNPKQEVKERNNPLIILPLTFVPSLMTPTMSFANPQTTAPISNILDPSVLIDWSLKAGLVGLSLSFGTTIILLMASGMYGALKRNKKDTKEWNSYIIKGFTQSLITIPIVYAMYYLAVTLFSNFAF